MLGALLPGACCDITVRSEAKDWLVPGSTAWLSVQVGAGVGSVFCAFPSFPQAGAGAGSVFSRLWSLHQGGRGTGTRP